MKEQSMEYIVNLASQVAGVNAEFKSAFIQYEAGIDPYDRKKSIQGLFVILSGTIVNRVKEMTPETLGRICAYGLYPGGLTGWADGSVFIRRTGIKDVHPEDFKAEKPGRELLEEIAVATIVATVFDILHQDNYQENVQWECDLDHQMDRADHAILHGRPSYRV